MSISFDNFFIVGADNHTYRGIRPGLVPAPFKGIRITCRGGKVITPIPAPERNVEDIIGFGGSIKVINDVMSASATPNYFYRLVVIYNDDSKWSVFFDFDGNIAGSEWG
jgi:hypothetical protein